MSQLKKVISDNVPAFWIVLITGCIIGSICALFLVSLDAVTQYRINHPILVYFLPIAGLLVGYLYHHWGREISGGNNLVIQEIKDPQKPLPWIMAPMIYIATLVTHLFGGSAGREGTAIQMSAPLSDLLMKIGKFDAQWRVMALQCAVAAGFGGVFGTPMAGAIFAFEFAATGKWNPKNLIFAAFSAFISDQTVTHLGVSHAHFLLRSMPEISLGTLFFTLVAGLFFGMMSYLFVKSMKTVSFKINQLFVFPPLRPFFGGIVLILLTSIIGSYNYIGLGVPLIESAFQEPAMFQVFFLKFLFTVLTLASGLKGGEVTPLFFIGATLGSALSLILPLPTSMLAGLGLVAVFAGVTKTPLASSLIALELFGWEMFLFALPVCYLINRFMGSNGIYTTSSSEISKAKAVS